MLLSQAGLLAFIAFSTSCVAQNSYSSLLARALGDPDLDGTLWTRDGNCGCPAGTTFTQSQSGPACFGACHDEYGQRVHRNPPPGSQQDSQSSGGKKCKAGQEVNPQTGKCESSAAAGAMQAHTGRKKNCPNGLTQDPFTGKCKPQCEKVKQCPNGMAQDTSDCKCKAIAKRSLAWFDDGFDLETRDAHRYRPRMRY